LNSFLLNLAERVIQRSDRDHPADAVLRAELKTQRDLLAQETAELSHAVFSYFRWYGWLSEGDDIHEKILQAIGLARLGFTTRSRSLQRSHALFKRSQNSGCARVQGRGRTLLNGWAIAGLSEPER
jgi:hypothetical protein